MAYTSDKTLYHDGNGHVSPSGGPGWELLVRKGGELRDADAARFGLIEPPKRGKKKDAARRFSLDDVAAEAEAAPQQGGS